MRVASHSICNLSFVIHESLDLFDHCRDGKYGRYIQDHYHGCVGHTQVSCKVKVGTVPTGLVRNTEVGT